MELIESWEVLEELNASCDGAQPLESAHFQFSRYVSQSEFNAMASLALTFEPYLSIAVACGMTHFCILKSKLRLYLGNINTGGHGARFEVRPVSLAQLKDIKLMTRLHQNYSYELGCHINLKADYPL